MDREITAGVELLNYSEQLMQTSLMLASAKEIARELVTLLSSETDAYYGKASESMVLFATQLGMQIGKLQMLYGKAAQYAVSTFDMLSQKDAALAVWLLEKMEKEER